MTTRRETLKRLGDLWDANLCACKKSPITLKDVDRADLASAFAELGLTNGVEIGTEEGKYAEVLCRENPDLQLTCIDPWEPYIGYREHVTPMVYEALMWLAQDRLAPYHVTFLRQYADDAVTAFADGSLDFVYIDGNHSLPYVLNDIRLWAPKVRSGGIVAGHDYANRRRCDVIDAVTGYTAEKGIRPLIVLGREKSPSWLWVQP